MQVNQFDTLVEALTNLRGRGFTHSFEFTENGGRIIESDEKIKPDEVTIVEHHRFEGDSSAGDMSIVYAVECKNGKKGVIVDSFGAYSNHYQADFLENVKLDEEN